MKKQIISLLFPARCPVCDGIAPFGERICPECLPGLKLLIPPWCMRCGKKVEEGREYCGDCMVRGHDFIRGRALYEYGSAADAIYRLKYGGRQEYADFFGEEIVRYLGEFIRETKAEALIPVPLHPKRFRKRGYNQAQLLAEAAGYCAGLPVYSHIVRRIHNTTPLKQLNPQERQNNLKKAFIIARNDVKLDTIIIIDDIYTTGSTIDEVARLLREHGVRRVYFITLACGAGV